MIDKLVYPPLSAFCSHYKMRYASCAYCKKRNVKCKLVCPTCGFEWDYDEYPTYDYRDK
jgi:hypothetical protein